MRLVYACLTAVCVITLGAIVYAGHENWAWVPAGIGAISLALSLDIERFLPRGKNHEEG